MKRDIYHTTKLTASECLELLSDYILECDREADDYEENISTDYDSDDSALHVFGVARQAQRILRKEKV